MLILIAERDEVVRKLQRHFLENAGFITEFVGDGEAAIESARRNRPALLITEILIPKVDGLALCRRLRADPLTIDIPVVGFQHSECGGACARSRSTGIPAQAAG
jgi:CheY-like chemotaxis protein